MTERPPVDHDELGGESACYAHLLCRECGVVLDGSDHATTCAWARRNTVATPGE
jgi:hypothetical protein